MKTSKKFEEYMLIERMLNYLDELDDIDIVSDEELKEVELNVEENVLDDDIEDDESFEHKF